MKHMLVCILFSGILYFLLACSSNPTFSTSPKIKGLSFVATSYKVDSSHFVPVKNIGADWITTMPFAFLRSATHNELIYNKSQQWIGERVEGIKETIRLAHLSGIKVCVKPQIWIGSGEFTGDLDYKSESDWKKFEVSYLDFILTYLRVAEESKSEYFCIGTELETFIEKRPQFWTKLIDSARSVYKGKLTYAENWDCYAKVPFWNLLDAIGIDAYFPLSDKKIASVSKLKKAWTPYLNQMESVSNNVDKPILFTEYGYRSMDYTTKKPWDYTEEHPMNEEAQARALQALYEACWDKPWFAGGFLWKWFPNHEQETGEKDTQFSPQGKKAEDLVRSWHLNH